MRRSLFIMIVPLVAVALALTVVPPASAHRTWTVIAGGGTRDLAIVANAFYPNTIEVASGDTVVWQFQGFHTVSFLSGEKPLPPEVREGDKTYFNPKVFFPAGGKTYDGTGYVNSGVPPLDPKAPPLKYSLTFTKPGTYQYFCLIHPGMVGNVTVKDTGVKGSPTAALRAGRRAQAATVRTGQSVFNASKVGKAGATVSISLLGDPNSGWSALRFTPRPVVISQGMTVTWRMADPFEIHTVTFLGGEKVPDFVLVEPQQGGPPKLQINPKAAAPAGTKTYSGTGFANSGILVPPGAPGPTSYSLTFTKPGTYEYICIVHVAEGMRSTIIVK